MLWELALIFLRLGATAFGGPLAHIALMRTEFVEKRGWLTEQEFLDLNGAVNLVPGPNSTELAMHIGHRRAGNAGLVVAGACFIVPAMLLVLMLAHLYKNFGTLPAARAILWGVSPVVVAVVIQALWKFAPVALKSRMAQALAALALMAGAAGISEIVLIFTAALVGLAAANRRSSRALAAFSPPLLLIVSPSVSAGGVFWSFLKMGCLVYGSGYVLLAYLRAELVENLEWISNQQLVDAVAVGQVTPGPVFTTATFLGYQIGGLWGGLAATAGIFGPSFVFVALLGMWLGKFAGSPKTRLFLDAVNAASFALMALVTFQLGREAVLSNGMFDSGALLLGLVAATLLLATKINSAWLLAMGALVGLLFGPR